MNLFFNSRDTRVLEYINKKSLLSRALQFILGCFIVSLAYNIFIAPNKIVPGGVGGIAIILNNLFGFDYSIMILYMNIVLLFASLFLLGKKKTTASIIGSILFPLLVNLTENINIYLQINTDNVLLSTIFGGILFGLGAGIVFKAGFTTGGTDIANQILSKYLKLSIGKSMLLCDGLIVLSSGIFFGINNMLYSILMLYIISLISDKVILGISYSKIFIIITEKEEEIKEFILKELGHGVTIFKAEGGYQNKKENVIMAVLPTKDYYKLKDGIKKIDEKAFYIINDAYEVFGGE